MLIHINRNLQIYVSIFFLMSIFITPPSFLMPLCDSPSHSCPCLLAILRQCSDLHSFTLGSLYFLNFYWNETTQYAFFFLASFPQHNYFETCPCCVYQQWPFYCWVVLHHTMSFSIHLIMDVRNDTKTSRNIRKQVFISM